MSSLFDFGKRYENTYQTAPLSFLGQKKNMLKVFFRVLEKYFKIDDDMVFLDLFGGSGLLSHHLKCHYPNNRVVWNDFNNYAERLKPERIKILKEIQAFANELLKEKAKEQPLSKAEKDELLNFIAQYPQDKLDFIQLSSWFCFSGSLCENFETFKRACKYMRLTTKTLQTQGYLDGVERVSGDYRLIYEKFKNEKLFVVADPPYLQTMNDSYKQHFTLGDFLDLNDILMKIDKWILFSSERSDIKPFLEWQNKTFHLNRKYHYHRAHLGSAGRGGLDMMIWKEL